MPKPISMTIEVEESFMGTVWRSLDGMSGVIRINIHGSGVPNKAPTPVNGRGSVKDGTTLKCVVIQMLKKTPGITTAQMVMGAESAGKNKKSLPPLINAMLKEKLIVGKAGKGKGAKPTYSLTAKGTAYCDENCAPI